MTGTHQDHALGLARAGFGVFPLARRGKLPLIPEKEGGKGHLDATTDLDQIKQWWTEHPFANIGLRPPLGVVVIDVDPRNGGDLLQLGDITRTWCARTGGGGWHLCYRCSGKVRSKVAGTRGIDIKGNSGYIVAPPSIHPNGTPYRWLNREPIAPLPEHLRPRVLAPIVQARPVWTDRHRGNGDGLVRFLASVQEGNRNDALYYAACRAYDDGGDPQLLHDLAIAAAGIGLSHNEIEQTIRSAGRRTA